MKSKKLIRWAWVGFLCLTFGCTSKKTDRPVFWIYTSLYNHVVQEFDTQLKQKFPQIEFKWFQAGSENVAARVNTELMSGKTQADLILTSDLFWYEDLKAKKLLLPYESAYVKSIPTAFKDPDHAWAVMRVPTMVIAYHSDSFSAAEAPKSFQDLTHEKFKNKVTMPSPLESGTAFTTVALLSQKLGWEYFSRLRNNGALATGGNSAVIARIETKERPVGIVLLENAIAQKRKNPKLVAVIPSEGALLIPSPIAIMASSAQPEMAKQVYDFFLSPDGQRTVVKGDHHAISFEAPNPEGAASLRELLAKSLPWNAAMIDQIRQNRDEIKKKFSAALLE